jgi:hypothetical protein
MGFLGGILTGSDPTLGKNIGNFQTAAGFDTGIGEGDVTKASQWYNDILSGDPTKMAEAVAPETAAIQGETQQAKDQTAQFGGRSGGTAAAIAGMDANSRAQIIKLLGGLQSGAAGSLGGLGTTEQGMATTNEEAADAASEQQLQNQKNSVLGKGIADFASTAENAGEGAMGL